MDIEGGEEAVLTELVTSGKLRSIRTLVCEYHHHLPTGSNRLAKTLQLLEQEGFAYSLLAHRSRPVRTAAHQDILLYARRSAS